MGPGEEPRNDQPVGSRRATIQAAPARNSPACACARSGHSQDLMIPDPTIVAASGIASQKPRLAAVSQCPMEHKVFSGDRKHDLTAPRNPRLEPYPIARSQGRPHRQTLRDELERTCRQGCPERLHEFRPGDLPGGHHGI
jgi:hypothetical protein